MSRWRRRGSLVLVGAATLAMAIAANLWALRFPARIDFTQRGVYSMGPETRAVLDGLDQPIRVTFFYDLRNQQHLDARALLERYAAHSSRLTVRSFDPDLQPGAARAMGVRFAGETVFEGAGPPIVMRGGSEEVFTNGLLRATTGAGRDLCFSAGHGESDPESRASHDHFEAEHDPGHTHSAAGGEARRVVERHGMGLAREALETLGYRVRREPLASGPEALAGCSVVVVAGPTSAFDAAEVSVLQGFVRSGGSAFFLLEPGVRTGLEPLLAEFGVTAPGSAVYDPTRHYWTDASTPAVSRYPRHRITRGLGLTFFPGVAALRPTPGGVPDDVVATPLLETSAEAFLADTPDENGIETLMIYAVRSEDRGGDNERTTRIAVIGDGDFATNSFLPVLGNRDLFLNTLHVLAEVERLIGIAPRRYASTQVELTAAQMRTTFVISTLLMPGFLLAIGAGVWWRQRT